MRILLAALMLSFSVMASANDSYWGVDYNMVDIDVEGISFDTGAIQGVYGKYVHSEAGTKFPLAIEGRLGLGITDDDVDGVTVETDYYFGIYARGEFAATHKLFPYALLGYSKIEATAKGFGGSLSDDDSDISFGIGTRYEHSEKFTFNLEYMFQMVDDVSGLSIGLRYDW